MGRYYLFVILFISIFWSCQKNNGVDFKLTPEEALQKVIKNKHLMSLEDEMQFIDLNNKNHIQIDLRTPNIAEEKPLPTATHIPMAGLLEKENLKFLRRQENIFLFSTNPAEANDAWFLLTQLGFENVYISAIALEETNELPDYDFAAYFNDAKKKHVEALEAGKPKPVVKKVIAPKPKKKKKVEEEEGC